MSIQDEAEVTSSERRRKLISVLHSGRFVAIRKLTKLLRPFSIEEKEIITRWAEAQARHGDAYHRDFAFYLMAKCEVSGEKILQILEQNKTSNRGVLRCIQVMLEHSDRTAVIDNYLFEVAQEQLLTENRAAVRDHARHMLMNLATTKDQWEKLTLRFSVDDIPDLRQNIIERVLRDCPYQEVLVSFCDNVVTRCLDSIKNTDAPSVHLEASHMHWIIMCLERTDQHNLLKEITNIFAEKFGLQSLPRFLRNKVESILDFQSD